MKIKPSKILCILTVLLCLLFCACTKQESTDAFEFCKSYNKLYGKDTIRYESILREDLEESCCYTFIGIPERVVLLTLDTEESGTVTGIALTITNDAAACTDDELSEFYKTYIRLSAVLLHLDYEEMEADITECSILPESIAFGTYDYETENDLAKFNIIANDSILTVYTEKLGVAQR